MEEQVTEFSLTEAESDRMELIDYKIRDVQKAFKALQDRKLDLINRIAYRVGIDSNDLGKYKMGEDGVFRLIGEQ